MCICMLKTCTYMCIWLYMYAHISIKLPGACAGFFGSSTNAFLKHFHAPSRFKLPKTGACSFLHVHNHQGKKCSAMATIVI